MNTTAFVQFAAAMNRTGNLNADVVDLIGFQSRTDFELSFKCREFSSDVVSDFIYTRIGESSLSFTKRRGEVLFTVVLTSSDCTYSEVLAELEEAKESARDDAKALDELEMISKTLTYKEL
jgi:hypothetical protein